MVSRCMLRDIVYLPGKFLAVHEYLFGMHRLGGVVSEGEDGLAMEVFGRDARLDSEVGFL